MVELQGKVKLSTAIMTHPGRIEAARTLAESVAGLSPKIVVDPAPTGRTLENSIRSWNAVEDDSSHHLVLQDDCYVCDDFIPTLLDAVSEMPDHALSLFTSWSSRTSNVVRLAALNGSRWAELCDPYLPCVALVLPARVARSFSLSSIGGNHLHDDFALLDHIKKHDVDAYVHVPNLVQHSEIPSVAGNHIGTRLSPCFYDDAAGSGRGVAQGGTILPYFSWSKRGSSWLHRRGGNQQWVDMSDEERFLEYLGIDMDELRSRYEWVCRGRPEIDGVVDGSTRHALWLSAFGLGMAAAGMGRVNLDTAAARAALATLAPGAWRVMVEDHVLVEKELTCAIRYQRSRPGGFVYKGWQGRQFQWNVASR
ncbi:hypothetical protein NKH18_16425 [Streptomyces sp. M10(2022)]